MTTKPSPYPLVTGIVSFACFLAIGWVAYRGFTHGLPDVGWLATTSLVVNLLHAGLLLGQASK